MNLNWEELSSLNSPSFYLVNSRTRDFDIFSNSNPEKIGVVTKLLRGKNCKTSKEIFKEFSSALQFPYYFGNNWDAFDECISDLSWLGENKGYVIFITDSDLLSEDLDLLLETLKDASAFWKEKNKIFKVVFQTENKINTKIEDAAEKRDLPPFDDIK